MERNYSTEEALMLILDQVDYVRGNCGVTDMVGAVLPKEIITIARKALGHDGQIRLSKA